MSMQDVVARYGLLPTTAAKVPLLAVKAHGKVTAGLAEVTFEQRYRNDEAQPVEAIYTFPAPSDGSVVGFSMTVGDRELAGEVLDRDEAFAAYDEALSAGHGAALLEQERGNVFTASVGNLLPGEETVIRLRYVQRLSSAEGAYRLAIPTLVAPRYTPAGVTDAERVQPTVAASGDPGYRLTVTVDWVGVTEITSPSHALSVAAIDGGLRATLADGAVRLDRDVVLLGAPAAAGEALEGVVFHDAPTGRYAAVNLLPELAGARTATRVVFLLDRSGSMGGDAMVEARRALRLCLRHLRAGDSFAILAFDDRVEEFSALRTRGGGGGLHPFSQEWLQRADAFLEGVDARGGTELLAPLQQAVALAGADGHVVILTDGQVSNEDAIAAEVLPAAQASGVSVHAFAIGLNVSDDLLRRLATQTGGALAAIFPGERIDEKVVAVFGRAVGVRVRGLEIAFEGFELEDLVPAVLPPLCDGEPFSLLGRVAAGSGTTGAVVLRGRLGGAPFTKRIVVGGARDADAGARTGSAGAPRTDNGEAPLDLFWARGRIADLEAQDVEGRRAEAHRKRIVELAKRFGLASRHTGFVVVEKRSGHRRAVDAAAPRPIPVAAAASSSPTAGHFAKKIAPQALRAAVPAPPPPAMPRAAFAGTGSPPPAPAPAPKAPGGPPRGESSASLFERAASAVGALFGGNGMAHADEASAGDGGGGRPLTPNAFVNEFDEMDEEAALAPQPARAATGAPAATAEAWFDLQRASGLFGADSGAAAATATATALWAAYRAGISTSHAVYGAQVKRALEALLALVATLPDGDDVEHLLTVALLLADGRQSQALVRAAVAARPTYAHLGTVDRSTLESHRF